MTFPTDKFSAANPYQETEVFLGDANRLKTSRSLGPKESYWVLPLTTDRLDYSVFQAVSVYLDHLLGRFKVFALPNPIPPIASRSGLALNAGANKGSESISIKNFPTSTSGAVRASDFLNISGHAKAYRIVFDANSNSSGVASVTITPPLVQNVTANSSINYGQNCVFQVSLKSRNSGDIVAGKTNFGIHDIELMEQL